MTSNPWTEWMDAHKADPCPLPPRIREMYRNFGRTECEKCKTCKHLLRNRMSKVYIKCTKSRMTHGPGTDWHTGWDACGLWETEHPICKEPPAGEQVADLVHCECGALMYQAYEAMIKDGRPGPEIGQAHDDYLEHWDKCTRCGYTNFREQRDGGKKRKPITIR